MQVGAHGRQLQYDGNWVRGRREGQGLCYYFNGETYQGGCLLCIVSYLIMCVKPLESVQQDP